MVTVANPTLTLATRGELFEAYRSLSDRLRLVFPERKFAHQVVPAQLSRTVWEAMVRRLPVVGIGFVGLTDGPGGRRYHTTARFMIFVGVRHARPELLLLGDPAGAPGALGVIGMAVAMLHGWTVPGLGTWTIGNVTNAYADGWTHDDVALVAIEASIGVQVVDEVAAEILPDFIAAGAQWDLPDMPPDTFDRVRPS